MGRKRYRSRFIEPGVISYEDVGQGLVMVGRDALDRMRPSFVGMPVFNLVHKDVDPDAAFDFENATSEDMAVGVVASVGRDEDGWDWAEMVIWDEDTQVNIDEKGFTVSCAYEADKSGPPGKYHGIKFDEEVLDGHYLHMAIVNNPRYEGSTIIQNAKGATTVAEPKAKKSWTIFPTKKNAEPTDEEKKKAEEEAKKKADEEAAKKNAEEGLQADEGAYMVIGGQKVPLQELVETYMGKQNAGEGQAIAPEDEITLPDGSKCTGADLLKAYQGNGGAAVENEGGGEPMPGGAGDKETLRTNSEGGPEKPNEHFLAVKKNAAKAPDEPVPVAPQTKNDRYAAGRERYGSAVPGGK